MTLSEFRERTKDLSGDYCIMLTIHSDDDISEDDTVELDVTALTVLDRYKEIYLEN